MKFKCNWGNCLFIPYVALLSSSITLFSFYFLQENVKIQPACCARHERWDAHESGATPDRAHSKVKADTFRETGKVRGGQVCILRVLSLPRAAAVQWAIMNPEFSPPSATRKAGSSLREGLHSLSILLSLIAASSWTPMAR